MSKFVKKPVEIEAHQWFKNGDHPEDGRSDWEGNVVRYYRNPSINGQIECLKCRDIMHNHGWIDTLEGGHIVCPGDWVVTGVKGEMHPCKPDIFEETYDPVD